MLVPLALTAALFLFLSLALLHGWFGPASAANRYFCEYVENGLIREPANTVSNLGFVAVGLVSAWLLWAEKFSRNENPLTRKPAVAILFSSLPILLGFGSMAMHASETDLGGELDLLAMYLMAGFMTAYAQRRYFGWGWGGFAVAMMLAVLFCEAIGAYREPVVPVLGYAGDAAFALLIAITVATETMNALWKKVKRENKWGIPALLSFLAAFAIWNFGRNDCPFCRPDSLWQPHALWHLLFALALFFLFRLYVSEGAPARKRR